MMSLGCHLPPSGALVLTIIHSEIFVHHRLMFSMYKEEVEYFVAVKDYHR